MANWRRLREQHLSDAEVLEEYAKLPPIDLVAQIIRARKSKGLTQEGLARLIGTKQPAIARIESGKYLGCSIETLLKIAEALETPITIKIKPRKKLKMRLSARGEGHAVNIKKAAEG
ncbi:MAG: helix-turn-helix transcriptional regulator [Candidatus Eremiobacteraeota bacterium]|nr:helix-turn-helix transcriptional regulator [Candidatus Eremiobacteraeota bacterium]